MNAYSSVPLAQTPSIVLRHWVQGRGIIQDSKGIILSSSHTGMLPNNGESKENAQRIGNSVYMSAGLNLSHSAVPVGNRFGPYRLFYDQSSHVAFSATLIGGNSGWRVCGSNGGFGYKATRFWVLGLGFPKKARQSEAAGQGWGHTGE